MSKIKKIGLALGSGGYRGFAHIGVIKSLEKHKIPINYLSGCSAGAIVAAYYARFKNIDKLEEDLMTKRREKIFLLFDLSRAGGLINGRKITIYLKKILGDSNFSDLKIPLKIVATNILNGQKYVFDHGRIASAVRASISIPLIFKPFNLEGKTLVDGGISDPVPVDSLTEMGATVSIGINLYNKNELIVKEVGMSNVLKRTTSIALYNLAQSSLKNCDIVIEPDLSYLSKKSTLSKYFTKEIAQEMILVGERETDKIIPKIKKKLNL